MKGPSLPRTALVLLLVGCSAQVGPGAPGRWTATWPPGEEATYPFPPRTVYREAAMTVVDLGYLPMESQDRRYLYACLHPARSRRPLYCLEVFLRSAGRGHTLARVSCPSRVDVSRSFLEALGDRLDDPHDAPAPPPTPWSR